MTSGLGSLIEHMYDADMPESRCGVSADIEQQIAEIAGHANVCNARLVALVAGALETGEWSGDRIHTPSQWVAWRAGVSPERAQQIVAVAERRSAFPCVIAAFDRGELTLDQVAAVVTKAPAWADAKVLDFARAATVSQLRKMMRSENFEGDPTKPETAPPAARDRLSTGQRGEGRWTISGELDAGDGATIDAALNDIKDELFRNGHTGVTMGEALVELAQRHL